MSVVETTLTRRQIANFPDPSEPAAQERISDWKQTVWIGTLPVHQSVGSFKYPLQDVGLPRDTKQIKVAITKRNASVDVEIANT